MSKTQTTEVNPKFLADLRAIGGDAAVVLFESRLVETPFGTMVEAELPFEAGDPDAALA